MPKVLTQSRVIKRLKKKYHSRNYNYDDVEYVSMRVLITMYCENEDEIHGLHGSWRQTPETLLYSRNGGCPKCIGKYKWTTVTWVEACIRRFNTSFGYDEAEYVDNLILVKIRCNTCMKYFHMRPPNHLIRGSGCPYCKKCHNYSTKEWIHEARKLHGRRYSYKKTIYIRSCDGVIITCRVHGDFEQRPNAHLKGGGCPSCRTRYSKPAIAWMEYVMDNDPNVNIIHARNGREFRIPGTMFFVDGYDEDNNTVYEFYGDYWHGNPSLFRKKDIHPHTGETYGSMYKKTKARRRAIEALGYHVIYIWDSDWKDLAREEECAYKIKDNDESSNEELSDSSL